MLKNPNRPLVPPSESLDLGAAASSSYSLDLDSDPRFTGKLDANDLGTKALFDPPVLRKQKEAKRLSQMEEAQLAQLAQDDLEAYLNQRPDEYGKDPNGNLLPSEEDLYNQTLNEARRERESMSLTDLATAAGEALARGDKTMADDLQDEILQGIADRAETHNWDQSTIDRRLSDLTRVMNDTEAARLKEQQTTTPATPPHAPESAPATQSEPTQTVPTAPVKPVQPRSPLQTSSGPGLGLGFPPVPARALASPTTSPQDSVESTPLPPAQSALGEGGALNMPPTSNKELTIGEITEPTLPAQQSPERVSENVKLITIEEAAQIMQAARVLNGKDASSELTPLQKDERRKEALKRIKVIMGRLEGLPLIGDNPDQTNRRTGSIPSRLFEQITKAAQALSIFATSPEERREAMRIIRETVDALDSGVIRAGEVDTEFEGLRPSNIVRKGPEAPQESEYMPVPGSSNSVILGDTVTKREGGVLGGLKRAFESLREHPYFKSFRRLVITDENIDEGRNSYVDRLQYSPANLNRGLAAGAHSIDKAAKINREFPDSSEQPSKNEDSLISLPNSGVFGVFDGVGGEVGGREASRTAARVLERKSSAMSKIKQTTSEDVVEWMRRYFSETRNTLDKSTRGDTTGVVARLYINETGDPMICIGHLGDSRAYIVDKNGWASRLTNDHGYKNVIYKAMGETDSTRADIVIVPFAEGDRLVLVTDGVTGDRYPDLMSTDAVGRIVHSSSSPKKAAEQLVKASTKLDDTTAIVIQPPESAASLF